MVTCDKCGTVNPLGRVFCGKCGAKLDLSKVSTDDIAAVSRARVWTIRIVKLAVTLLVLGCIAVAGVAFAPRTDLLGQVGSRTEGRRLGSQFRLLQNLQAGQRVALECTEAQLNAYLAFVKGEKMPGTALAVALQPRRMVVRMTRWKQSIKMGPVEIQPQFTWDVELAVSGGKLVVTGASMGRLPLVGGLRSIAVGRVQRLVAAQPEWESIRGASDISITARGFRAEFSR